jgi:hypothetical protein
VLLTAGELERRKREAPQEKIEPILAEKPKPKTRGAVRMFHPDSTSRSPISCEFTLEGESVKLVRGVAEVPLDLAPVLLKSGWIMGKKLDKEWNR